MKQPGMHPDADTLTAFAEQLLPATEREQVLAHAAVCSRCREVIFLAEQAAADEQVMAAPIPSTPLESARSWWPGGWRWAWVPIGAFAVLIGAAVVLHFRTAEKPTQMAGNLASSEALQQVSPPAAQSANSPQSRPAERNALRKAKPQIARDQRAIQQKEEALDEKGIAKQDNLALASPAPLVNVSPGLAGGSLHGTFKARAKDTPYGGPVANELQQNAIQQQNAFQQNNQPRQNPLQAAQGLDQKSASARLAPSQPAVPDASQTVTVQVDAAETKPIAQPSAPPMQLSYVPMSGKNLELSPAATAQLKKTAKIALPGGAQPLSVAFAAGHAIALDTTGALFLSEDQGKHWQPIATQWTGRAVLVRNMEARKDKVDALQSVQPIPAVHFELVNDKLQTWKSSDGKTWTAAEPIPDK